MSELFVHEPPSELDYEPLSITYKNGTRYYEVEPGVKYPSMTSVLSILSRDSIAAWKKRVGNKEANAISKEARERGTEVHSICEDYLNNKEDYGLGNLPDAIELFQVFKEPLAKNLTKIYHLEPALYSNELGIAGRADCIGEWMGVPVILDFKTSRRPKKEEWVDSYFMQGAGYSKMYEEMTGIKIDHILIMVAVNGDYGRLPSIQYFPAPVKDWVGPLEETIERYRQENDS